MNGDYSGLTDEEENEIKRFLENAEGTPVDVKWGIEGFCHYNDAGTLPCDCVVFVFVKDSF